LAACVGDIAGVGGREVVARVEKESETPTELVLHFTVTDTGIGIPKDKQAVIFDALTQADGSATRKYGGTGLGLSISTQLVQMMGGRMWVESEEGQGSKFHFKVRFGWREGKELGKTPPAPAAQLHDLPVLLVDENATNRHILTEILASWGLKPTAVHNGEAALAALARSWEAGKLFPLIITDAQMPGMDGFTLIELIHGHPEFSTATIMMLSSAGQKGDAARCRKLGVAAYLTKPIRPSELKEAVLAVLGTKSNERPSSKLVTRHTVREQRRANKALKVLLAEDNPVNQHLAVRLLRKRGHQVVLADNGLEALSALEKQNFDLVLMDVQMPEMGGFEATAQIRQRERSTGAHIPVVAMTAHAMTGDREKCLAAGMDAYVSKPVRREELFATIENLFSAKS